MSVCGTLCSPLVSSGSIAIAHPVHCILKYTVIFIGRALKLYTYHYHGLGIYLTAELDELISAKTVLVIIHPHPVRPALTVLLGADTPLPIILGHISTAWPAQTGRMQFLNGLQNIRPETAQVLTSLSGQSNHINLYGTALDYYGKITVTTHLFYITPYHLQSQFEIIKVAERLRYKGKFIFFPLFAVNLA